MTRPRLIPEVSLGHLVTAAALVASVSIAWADLRGDIDSNTRRITDAERRIESVPERLARIEAILERMERRQSR